MIPKFIEQMDWSLLRDQKERLMAISNNFEEEEIEGIISLIDAIQDYAIDEVGLPKQYVMGVFKD